MSRTNFEELFNKFLGEKMTAEEIDRLRNLYDDENNFAVRDEMLKAVFANKASAETKGYDPEEIFQELLARVEEHGVENETSASVVMRQRRFRTSYAAAAVLLAVLVAGACFFVNNRKHTSPATAPGIASPKPGGNKAVLTLADGSIIALDSAQNGELSRQGGVRVVKIDSGLLSCKANLTGKGAAGYNTITTPRGGQYQIILPDGTHAWLNSASSLTFPSAFEGKERKVTLTGEGYFEVTENAGRPFVVVAGEVQTTVIGTHFDMNAYNDENSINTTLLEGAVIVSAGNGRQLLKPGQQALVDNSTRSLSLQQVDVLRVIAWKNGLFDFKGADVFTIMRQLARWYDVQIAYQGDLSDVKLSGMISRRADVAQILHLMEATDRVRFFMQGNKIIVSPYK